MMGQLMCCAISEMDGLQEDYSTPKGHLKTADDCAKHLRDNLARYGSWRKMAYMVFSVNQGRYRNNGPALAQYIKDQGLGEVICCGEKRYNPNSRAKVSMWVWVVDQKAYTKWKREQNKILQKEGKATRPMYDLW